VFVVSHVSVVGVVPVVDEELVRPVDVLVLVVEVVAVVVELVWDIKLIVAYAPPAAIITMTTTTITIVPAREIPNLLLKRFIPFFTS
jgi:hypothetical protein